MNNITIENDSERNYCDICQQLKDTYSVIYTIKDPCFDLCEGCLLSLGTAIRKRAVNKVLGIRKDN